MKMTPKLYNGSQEAKNDFMLRQNWADMQAARQQKPTPSFKRFLARQKLRFSYGVTYLPLVTLAVLIAGLHEGLYTLTGLRLRVLFPLLFLGAVFAVWLGGWISDVYGLIRAEITEMNERNEAMKKIDKHLDRQP